MLYLFPIITFGYSYLFTTFVEAGAINQLMTSLSLSGQSGTCHATRRFYWLQVKCYLHII